MAQKESGIVRMKRRTFLATAAAGIAAAQDSTQDTPDFLKRLHSMMDGVQPITDNERRARIEKARSLMRDYKIAALVMEGGSSLYYFTGVRMQPSEHTSAAILPAKGDLVWVLPESAAVNPGGDVRSYKDDEAAYKTLMQALKDRGAGTGKVGIEERTRFAVFDGLRKESPATQFVSGDPVTIGCRVIKSPAEIALMQRANDITIAAYKAAFAVMREGMTQGEFSDNIAKAYRVLGAPGFAMVSFGEFTAFPHGSIQPQKLKPGDIVLVDDGCTVEGYQSDITRTTVFGKPTDRQRRVWELERKAQDAALAAAKPGATCESVDAAARKVIEAAGFGPGYKVPGLPHRTGHGIGLDGHEWTYLVKGNKTILRPGMCFSDEPMIAIYGEFGIRLEDCMYITEDGARMFTRQSPAIDQPFG